MAGKKVSDRFKTIVKESNSKHATNKFMASKLMEMYDNDKIHSDYDSGFIKSVFSLTQAGKPLSALQEAYLEKIFHDIY